MAKMGYYGSSMDYDVKESHVIIVNLGYYRACVRVRVRVCNTIYFIL